MPWDWNFVGEQVVGIAGGIVVGSYVAVAILRAFFYEAVAHPTVRKFASAAEKLAGAKSGIIEQFLGWLTGGGGGGGGGN